MKVSYVIPTKNRAPLIKECLEAFLEQTDPSFEVIIVDDHGSDNTKDVVKQFNNKKFCYYYLRNDYGSRIACARNYGNMLATGDLIAPFDSDDIPLPTRTSITIQEFEMDKKLDMIYAKLLLWDPETNDTRDRKTPYLPCSFARLKQQNFLPHPSVVYRKEIAYLFPYNSIFRVVEDYELYLRIFKSKRKIKFIDEYFLKYRMAGQNESLKNSHIHKKTDTDNRIYWFLELAKKYHTDKKIANQVISNISQ